MDGVVDDRGVAQPPRHAFRLSAWIQRTPLIARPLRVQVTHFDADGATIAVEPFTFTGATSYTYRQATVVTPETAVTMELVLHADPTPGAVFVDDIRLIDDNLLVNGGFETRPANGRDDESPGWRFEAGGARVVTDEVRSGRRAVAIEALATDFRQVTQDIRDLAGASRLRVTAWLRTGGASEPPTITARFDVDGDVIIAEEASENEWSLVGRTIDVPAAAEQLTLHVRVERGTTGTTYLDDVLVVPVGEGAQARLKQIAGTVVRAD